VIWTLLKAGEARGVRYEIGTYDNLAGVRWRIPRVDCWGHPMAPIESSGAFYDGCNDHPEGAVAWAEASILGVLS
jgi:hypothetical protein